jgi:uncharacterized protein YbjT (DUF2867 family)
MNFVHIMTAINALPSLFSQLHPRFHALDSADEQNLRLRRMKMLYAIAGVSGNTGRVAAETLLAAGQQVRVIVRDAKKGEPWRARGAEVAVADVGDSAALAAALTGVNGVYLLLPPRMAPGFRAYQLETGRAIIAAIAQAKPAHVVFLSSIGAQHSSGTGPIAGLYPIEQGLRAVNEKNPEVNVTFLRAGYFIENLASSFAALPHGIIPNYCPVDAPIDMVGTTDIGQTAALLLREGGHGVQIVQLGGPARTTNDVAAALTRLLGKPITAVEAPLAELVPTFTSFGMPVDLAELYREMLGSFSSGLVRWEAGHRRIESTTPLDTVLGSLLKSGASH